ncbi:MAG: hypothetical protein ACXWFC_14580 [Nitrososphaeraceae archaeon]
MNQLSFFKYIFLIIVLLSAMLFISNTFTLLTNIQNFFVTIISVTCVLLGVIVIVKMYNSFISPLKPKYWIAIISSGIIITGLILFSVIYVIAFCTPEGFFATHVNTYKLKNFTFYTYETSFAGTTSTSVRYSAKRELISHSVENMFLPCSADSVSIQQKDTSFLIIAQKQKFLFLPKSKKVIDISN